jgi:uncharacterized protein (TIGR00369 family)
METLPDPPEGFARHDRRSPLTDPWEPIWRRDTDTAVILAVRAGPAHTNSRGFVHGGLITALADNAMGLSCAKQLGDGGRLVTVNLTVDFLGVAQVGQWLSVETGFVRLGGSLAFTQAFVTADGEPCARANAVFKLVRKAAA